MPLNPDVPHALYRKWEVGNESVRGLENERAISVTPFSDFFPMTHGSNNIVQCYREPMNHGLYNIVQFMMDGEWAIHGL